MGDIRFPPKILFVKILDLVGRNILEKVAEITSTALSMDMFCKFNTQKFLSGKHRAKKKILNPGSCSLLSKAMFLCPCIGWCRGHIFFPFSHVGTCTCIRIYVLYECVYICMYVRDPVRLSFRHLYQVEFCSFYSQVHHSGGIRVLWTHF